MIKANQVYKTTKPWREGTIPEGSLLVTVFEAGDNWDRFDRFWLCDVKSPEGEVLNKQTWIIERDVEEGNAVLVPVSTLPNTIIILNSPPNSGKDVLCKGLCEATGASHSEFKAHLRQCTATLFNVPVETLRGLCDDRETKEVPHTLFSLNYGGMCDLAIAQKRAKPSLCGGGIISPREALIYTSECVFKPAMGDDYFGKIAADNIDMNMGAIFSDGGFDEELTPIINKHGADNVFVVQFTREGTSFEGDSRNYLNVPDSVAKLVTTNDGDLNDLRDEVLEWVDYVRATQAEDIGG